MWYFLTENRNCIKQINFFISWNDSDVFLDKYTRAVFTW
ncbi:hypothetical protein D1AOALGA4SA_11949 [Olavius algarvensis Delta 1 endosymbiont]|nr:hypothetical protein D1AOALGA4SA_11949 [Olavius algarvensis Delta 1 endosymbiont]